MKRIDLRKTTVARADTIRAINRQIVLNYVRERAPISRAAIAQETALQRSTISLIVDELKTAGLVEEIEGESTGGRPPVMLRMRATVPVAIGVGIGAKQTIVAVSDLAGRVLEQEEFTTVANAGETLRRVIERSRLLIARSKGSVESIGVSLPGVVNYYTGDVLFVPSFRWQNWELRRGLESATGLPVIVDNDANAAALAELWFGRPEIRDVRNFVFVLVEEGLGTGIVFDGQVYRGKLGAAGEFGHMTIGSNAPIACAAGSRECWEAFASERAAIARYEPSALNPHPGESIRFDTILDLAFDREPLALAALGDTTRYLAIGVANIIKALSPDAVVLGGRISRAWPLIEKQLKHVVDENSVCRDLPVPRIIVSSLGEQPQLMGALSLVLASKFASA